MASIVGTTLVAVSLRLYEAEEAHNAIAFVCGAAGLGLIVYARQILRVPWTSASMVYLCLFWMFHFGLAFTIAVIPEMRSSFDPRATIFDQRVVEWYHWPNVRFAMLLSLLGAAGFVTGIGMNGRWAGSQKSVESRSGLPSHFALYAVGWCVMLAGLVLSIWALINDVGINVFALGYRQFRVDVLSSSDLFRFIQLSQLGCLLALCGAGGRRWIAPLMLWGAFGAVLLLLGLRNEAMIPIVSFIVVLMHRGVRFHRGVLVGGCLIAILAMPAIRTFRTVGFANRVLVDWTAILPLGTLIELGGTLRAVKAYVDWIDEGDRFLLGASYWAPLDRHFLVWVMPGRRQTPIERDERVPARDISVREGPVGASSTGEAYYNFGPLGPLLFFGCVGALFSALERRAAGSGYRTALLGVILFPFFWNIRGQWIPVPAQVAAGLLLLGVCYALDRPPAERTVSGAA